MAFLYTDNELLGESLRENFPLARPDCNHLRVTPVRGNPGKKKLTLYHQAEEFGKGQKKEENCVCVLPLELN